MWVTVVLLLCSLTQALPKGLESFPPWALEKLEGKQWTTPGTEFLKKALQHPPGDDYCASGSVLSEDPLICVYDNVISPEEAEHLMSLAGRKLRKATVEADKRVYSKGRSSMSCWLQHDSDAVVKDVVERVAALVGLPSDNSEDLQVFKYGVGGEYRAHMDAFPPIIPETGDVVNKPGGQRLVTALAYLKSPTLGGYTEFPHVNARIEPVFGRVVVFHLCEPGNNLADGRALHAGLPVLEGTKWGFNLWFREGSYQSLEGLDKLREQAEHDGRRLKRRRKKKRKGKMRKKTG